MIRKLLEENGIEITGYLVDEKYLPIDEKNRYIDGKRIFSKKETDINSAVILAIQKDLYKPFDISSINDFRTKYVFDL
ncbi:MAG: hypothetical protein IK093_15580, partial [Ruminiclostridium sp.]|nr:hypothetical protein [Ruminiclostridium sp.]